jgi:hypothetical protein
MKRMKKEKAKRKNKDQHVQRLQQPVRQIQ